MKRWWRDHSLTIVTTASGSAVMAAVYPLQEGALFDLVSGFGNSLLAIGVGGFLFGFFRERNKPED